MTDHKVVGTGAAQAAPRVGVVGGGQLARMMQEAAIALGIEMHALVEAADGAAGQAVVHSSVGAAHDRAAVAELAGKVDVLTVEHEHVPPDILGDFGARPGPQALAYAQDKLLMRQKMEELGVPCPRWMAVRDVRQAAAAAAQMPGGIVIKTPRGGYDGKGVAFDLEGAAAWFEEFPEGILVEERVPFTREIAQLVARRPSGEMASWCAVETIQDGGMCFETIAPAPIDEELAGQARRIGESIAQGLGVVGVLAVEMFVTEQGLLVNELAMRPHNSGHWTIEGAATSQFEQHLRAVLDLPLGETTARARHAVMVNVLGSRLDDPRQAYPRVMEVYPEAKIHMYGKAVTARRKLGHVTVVGDDLGRAREAAEGAAALLRGERMEA